MTEATVNPLWLTFCEFWPMYIEHVDSVEEMKDGCICIKFKHDDYHTSGSTFIFGSTREGQYNLKRIPERDHQELEECQDAAKV